MTMITPSYLGETIEYSSLHACRSTLEDPTGNFRGEDPYADLAQLAPYAINVQVKTEISTKGQKPEEADLARIIGVLREARYSGYVVLEYEAAEDPMTAVPRHIKALRQVIGA